MNDNRETHSIVIDRDYPAAQQQVFAAWVEPELVIKWFAPPGYTITECELEAEPGGPWHIEYRDPHDRAYSERGVRQSVDPPNALSFTLMQIDDTFTGPETLITVTLSATDAATRMRFEQTGFRSATLRDVSEEGWRECFDKLGEVLGGRSE